MGMTAILFNDAEPFKQTDKTRSTEGPLWTLVKIGQAVLEKMTFKVYEILYMYIAQRQEPIILRDKILFFTKRGCYCDYTM